MALDLDNRYEEKKELSEQEKIFLEDIEFIKKANHVAKQFNMEQAQLMIEYQMLKERYEKLLKTSIRIAKMGDKAQKKLLKFKELLNTL